MDAAAGPCRLVLVAASTGSRWRRWTSTRTSRTTTRQLLDRAQAGLRRAGARPDARAAGAAGAGVRARQGVPAVPRPALRRGQDAVQDAPGRVRAARRLHRVLRGGQRRRRTGGRGLLRPVRAAAAPLPRRRRRRPGRRRAAGRGRRAAALGYEIGGDRLRTRPRGTPEDHPRLELLRHRSLSAGLAYGCPTGCTPPSSPTGSRPTGAPSSRWSPGWPRTCRAVATPADDGNHSPRIRPLSANSGSSAARLASVQPTADVSVRAAWLADAPSIATVQVSAWRDSYVDCCPPRCSTSSTPSRSRSAGAARWTSPATRATGCSSRWSGPPCAASR